MYIKILFLIYHLTFFVSKTKRESKKNNAKVCQKM